MSLGNTCLFWHHHTHLKIVVSGGVPRKNGPRFTLKNS